MQMVAGPSNSNMVADKEFRFFQGEPSKTLEGYRIQLGILEQQNKERLTPGLDNIEIISARQFHTFARINEGSAADSSLGAQDGTSKDFSTSSPSTAAPAQQSDNVSTPNSLIPQRKSSLTIQSAFEIAILKQQLALSQIENARLSSDNAALRHRFERRSNLSTATKIKLEGQLAETQQILGIANTELERLQKQDDTRVSNARKEIGSLKNVNAILETLLAQKDAKIERLVAIEDTADQAEAVVEDQKRQIRDLRDQKQQLLDASMDLFERNTGLHRYVRELQQVLADEQARSRELDDAVDQSTRLTIIARDERDENAHSLMMLGRNFTGLVEENRALQQELEKKKEGRPWLNEMQEVRRLRGLLDDKEAHIIWLSEMFTRQMQKVGELKAQLGDAHENQKWLYGEIEGMNASQDDSEVEWSSEMLYAPRPQPPERLSESPEHYQQSPEYWPNFLEYSPQTPSSASNATPIHHNNSQFPYRHGIAPLLSPSLGNPSVPSLDELQMGNRASSPSFSAGTPTYSPTSPEYSPETPEYRPDSPTYTPTSPEYEPDTPEYRPESPPYNWGPEVEPEAEAGETPSPSTLRGDESSAHVFNSGCNPCPSPSPCDLCCRVPGCAGTRDISPARSVIENIPRSPINNHSTNPEPEGLGTWGYAEAYSEEFRQREREREKCERREVEGRKKSWEWEDDNAEEEMKMPPAKRLRYRY
jgi:hypothetical protein